MKNSHLNKFWCIILLGVMLMIPSVLGYFPTKEIKPSTSTNEYAKVYPAIEINDWLGFGGTLADIQLEEHTSWCSDNCYSEFDITTSTRGRLIDSIKFIGSGLKSYKIYIQDGTTQVEKEILEKECVNTGKINITGGEEIICSFVKKKINVEEKVFVLYNYEEKDAGSYRIRIEGKKSEKSIIDWIITTQGKEVDELSVWGDILLSNGLMGYWDWSDVKNKINNSIANLSVGVGSVGASVGYGTGCLSGNCGYIVGGDVSWFELNNLNVNNNHYLDLNITSRTMNMWFKVDADEGHSGKIIVSDTDAPSITCGISGTDCVHPVSDWGFDTSNTNHRGNWVMFTVVRNASGSCSYWNGTFKGCGTDTSYPRPNPAKSLDRWIIGTNHDLVETSMHLYYDEWALWYRELSQSEISTLWNNGVGLFYANFSSSSITLNSPVDNYISLGNIVFNCSINIGDGTPVNISLWTNSSGTWKIEQTNIVNVDLNKTGFNQTFTKGFYLWNCQGCDTNGDCGFSSSNRTFQISDMSINNVTYNQTTTEGKVEGFTLNSSINPSSWISITGNLWYNGIKYPATIIQNGNELIETTSINIPLVTSSVETKTFLFEINLVGVGVTSNINSSTYSQNVSKSTLMVISNTCPAGLSIGANLTMQDEENLTRLNYDVNWNIAYSFGGTANITLYGSLNNTDQTLICINTTENPQWTIMDGQIFYSKSGWSSRRFYIYDKQVLTNNTLNITLYDLLSTLQTSFQLSVESTSLQTYNNKYVSLIRWYPNTNSYNVVDMGKTDDTGSTIIHVKTEDVDYRFGVYERNGTLIKMFNPIRMICTVAPCTYTLKISPSDIDYTSLYDIQYTFDFNETSGIFTFIYNDASQRTSTMNITAYKSNGITDYSICSNIITGYSGAITCNASGYTGIITAKITRVASPPVTIITKIVQIFNTAWKSSWGLWLSMLIAIPIIAIFSMISPIAMIIAGIVSLIPALYFGAVNWMIIAGLAVAGGIVIHFMKKI
jgi:hypothetical protein